VITALLAVGLFGLANGGSAQAGLLGHGCNDCCGPTIVNSCDPCANAAPSCCRPGLLSRLRDHMAAKHACGGCAAEPSCGCAAPVVEPSCGCAAAEPSCGLAAPSCGCEAVSACDPCARKCGPGLLARLRDHLRAKRACGGCGGCGAAPACECAAEPSCGVAAPCGCN
jgi:hypothetical protein